MLTSPRSNDNNLAQIHHTPKILAQENLELAQILANFDSPLTSPMPRPKPSPRTPLA